METKAIHHNNPMRAVLPVGIAATLALLGDLALFASLPMNVAVVGISIANLGLVFGIHRLVRLPGNPLVGFLINQRRRRPFFLMGMGFAVLSTLGYVLAAGLPLLIVSRVCWGIGWALVYLCSMAIVMDVTTEVNRGKWMGFFNTWYLIGIAGGSLLGGFLSDQIGFRGAMLVCTVLTMIGFLQAVIFLPETVQQEDSPTGNTQNGNQTLSEKVKSFGAMMFSSRSLPIILFIYMVNQFAAEGVALSILSLLLQARFIEGLFLGDTLIGIASLNGFLLAFRYLLSALISPLVGDWSDRIRNGRFWLLVLGLLVSVVSFIVLAASQSILWIILAMVLNAIGGAAVLVALPSLLGDHAPKDSAGKILGIYATAGDLGSALGPMFAYFLLGYIAVGNVFLICGIFLAFCLLGGLAGLKTVRVK